VARPADRARAVSSEGQVLAGQARYPGVTFPPRSMAYGASRGGLVVLPGLKQFGFHHAPPDKRCRGIFKPDLTAGRFPGAKPALVPRACPLVGFGARARSSRRSIEDGVSGGARRDERVHRRPGTQGAGDDGGRFDCIAGNRPRPARAASGRGRSGVRSRRRRGCLGLVAAQAEDAQGGIPPSPCTVPA